MGCLLQEQTLSENGIEQKDVIQYKDGGSIEVDILDEKEIKWYKKYNKRHWTVFTMMACINFSAGLSLSVVAPFFPKLASMKNISSSICGLIFSSYELIILIVSPILGRKVRSIGGKWLLVCGLGIMGLAKFFVGVLEKCPPGIPFISSSFIIFMFEGLGQTSFKIGVFVTISQEFPEDVPSFFSILEAAYGVGLVTGPTLGSYLFKLGGFIAPHGFVSIISLMTTSAIILFLPIKESTMEISGNFKKLLRLPGIFVSLYTIFSFAFTYGFNIVLLEPFLRQFNLSSVEKGFVFLIDGLTFLIFAPVWGYLIGKKINANVKLLNGISGILICLAYIILGPAPFLPIDPNLWYAVISLIIYGITGTGHFICSLLDCREEAISGGNPPGIETSGLVSGLWYSVYAFGNLIGHSVAGILNDVVGFRNTTLVVVGLEIFVIIFNFGMYFRWKNAKKNSGLLDIKVELRSMQ